MDAGYNCQDPLNYVGVTCTAALSTNRDRRGENRCFVATYQSGHVLLHKVSLPKGSRTREEEDCMVSRWVTCALPPVCLLRARLTWLWPQSRVVGVRASCEVSIGRGAGAA